MAQGTTCGLPREETSSSVGVKPGDPRPESPRTISSLTSSIPGAFPDDVASIASIKSGIAPAVPGMPGALAGSSAVPNKSFPDTQNETGSGGELRNGSDDSSEGSSDIRGDPYGKSTAIGVAPGADSHPSSTTDPYLTQPPPEPELKTASDIEGTLTAGELTDYNHQSSQHEPLGMSIGSGSLDMGRYLLDPGAPAAQRADPYDNQRVPITIGATTNERRKSRDAAITGALGTGFLARKHIGNYEHGKQN